jgi:hypothetical protein
MQFTLSKSLKASMVQNGARLAPFCTIFAFCGAERSGTEIYMPGAECRIFLLQFAICSLPFSVFLLSLVSTSFHFRFSVLYILYAEYSAVRYSSTLCTHAIYHISQLCTRVPLTGCYTDNSRAVPCPLYALSEEMYFPVLVRYFIFESFASSTAISII